MTQWKQFSVKPACVHSGSLKESREALELCRRYEQSSAFALFSQSESNSLPSLRHLYCTVGCHPTRCNDMEHYTGGAPAYVDSLVELVNSNPDVVAAVGEMGLDFDRCATPLSISRTSSSSTTRTTILARVPCVKVALLSERGSAAEFRDSIGAREAHRSANVSALPRCIRRLRGDSGQTSRRHSRSANCTREATARRSARSSCCRRR